MPLTPRELTTVLAALRYWQDASIQCGPAGMMPKHFADTEPLSLAEIDALCERLNLGDGEEGR